MKYLVGNSWSLVAACGALLTFGVGDAPALVGTVLGLVLAWRWFGRLGRSEFFCKMLHHLATGTRNEARRRPYGGGAVALFFAIGRNATAIWGRLVIAGAS